MQLHDLKQTEQTVLTHLAGIPEDQQTWPSIRDLGAAVGVGKSATQTALANLEKHGLIVRKPPHVTPAGRETVAANGETVETEKAHGVRILPDDIKLLPWRLLHPSKLNPRQTDDPDDTLGELVASIQAQGVLQSLLVRPLKDDFGLDSDHVEIVAGHRRYAAVKRLIDTKRATDDYPMPVRVIEVDDEGVVLAALVENLQRRDMPAIDEGEAYAAYAARHGGYGKGVVQQLADATGKSKRHIEGRIALVRDLSPIVKEAVATGDIGPTMAREIARADKKQQTELLANVRRGYHGYHTTAEVAARIADGKPPLAYAIFELDKYDGEILPDPDDFNDTGGDWRRFADVAQFRRLQAEAVEAKKAELEASFAFVKVISQKNYTSLDYVGTKKAKDAGALILCDDDGSVDIVENVKPRPVADAAAKAKKPDATVEPTAPAAAPRPDSETFTEKLKMLARHQKTAALQLALADNVHVAMAAVVVGLCGAGHVVKIRKEARRIDDYSFVTPLAETLTDLLAEPHKKHFFEKDYAGLEKPERLFDWLLKSDDLEAIFAHFVARECGSWVEHDVNLGDDPLAVAMADATGAEVKQFEMTEDYLKSCRTSRLKAIARECGINDAALELMPNKKSELVQWILDQPSRDDKYVPPEMRFGGKLLIEAAIDNSVKGK